MKQFVVVLLLLGGAGTSRGQSFLTHYQRYMKKHWLRKSWARRAQRAELKLLGNLFAGYQQQTGRQLGDADTLNLLTETPVEMSNVYAPTAGMIWNRTDTLAFRLEYAPTPPYSVAAIRYEPFLQSVAAYNRYTDVSRDTLVALLSRRQFARAQQLAADHPVLDGSYRQVVVAVRTPKGYQITAFGLPAFGFIRGGKTRN